MAVGNGTGRCVVLGAHGGAGTTTVARILRWPVAEAVADVEGFESCDAVVLVARASWYGADSAEAIWPRLPPSASRFLVLNADAPGRAPRPLVSRLHRLAGQAQGCVWLPYCPVWRSAPADVSTASRGFRRRAAELRGMVPAA